MAFTAQPMQPGMLFDAAARVAASPNISTDQDTIGEMGWPLILLPEAQGGLGGNLSDLTALVEGVAAHASHLPIIERCAVAPLLLLAGGDARWLSGLADGSMRVSPLVGSKAPDLADFALTATPSGDSYNLKGKVLGVDATGGATHWVAIVQLDAQLGLLVLESSELPPPSNRHIGMDGRATVDFRLDGVTVPKERCIAIGASAEEAIAQASRAALAMVCADSVAVLGALVEHTITYLHGRVQFGVALSTFQALRHQLVNVYMCYESGRGMVTHFLANADQDLATDKRRLSLTKLALGESARYSAETVIQLHGGMGMTEEMLAARLAKRLLTNEFRYGDRFRHSASLTLQH